MVAAVETHPQRRAKPAEALYHAAIVALVGAALLGPAMLTFGDKLDAVDIRVACAFTCIDVAVLQPQAASANGERTQDAFLHTVADRPDGVEITLSRAALRPVLVRSPLPVGRRGS